MKIREYIESGILESYVSGAASDEEVKELMQLKKQYPEIRDALFELETDLERIAQYMAIAPPPGMLTKIEDEINSLKYREEAVPKLKRRDAGRSKFDRTPGSPFIEVEAESSHMRIHTNIKAHVGCNGVVMFRVRLGDHKTLAVGKTVMVAVRFFLEYVGHF